MNIYLRWYYGYKNRWDELLLLWVLWYIYSSYNPDSIIIQSDDINRLEQWLATHTLVIEKLWIRSSIISVSHTTPFSPKKNSILVLWWWEIMTDARPFPYNGWTYLKFLAWIISQKTVLLGGLWTIKKFGTWLLYKLLIWTAKAVITREVFSYDIAKTYTKNAILHRDFAYDVLDCVTPILFVSQRPYIIVNINKHIREKGIDILCDSLESYVHSHDMYFFPGTVWDEDSDASLYTMLLDLFPWMLLYDWTQHTISQTMWFVQWADFWIAARLHIVLLLKHFDIRFQPLIYQEKVQRILNHSF